MKNKIKNKIILIALIGLFVNFIFPVTSSSFTSTNLGDGVVEITNEQNTFSITGSNIGLDENTNQINFLDREGALTIKDSNGIVMTELSGLKTSEEVGNPSGYITLDENGNVIKFDGVANKETTIVKINGNQYSMTKDTRLTLKDNLFTVKSAKKGDPFSVISSSKNEEGKEDLVSTSIELGENQLNIKKSENETIFSSVSDFKINNLKVEKLGRKGEISISVDPNGKFSSYENAKINFNNGIITSSLIKTNIYYDKLCNLQGNYLCIESDRLILNSKDANSQQILEFKNGNPYFATSKSTDNLQITSIGNSGIEIIKDQASIIGEAEIRNGQEILTIDSNGNVVSKKVISEFTSFPIELFSQKSDGTLTKLGNKKIVFDENGNYKIEDLSFIGKTQAEATAILRKHSNLYSYPEQDVSKVIPELDIEIISPSLRQSNEEIAAIRLVFNSNGKLIVGTKSSMNTMATSISRINFDMFCNENGINPDLPYNELVKSLEEKAKENTQFAFTFGTRINKETTKKRYGFGNQEILNKL